VETYGLRTVLRPGRAHSEMPRCLPSRPVFCHLTVAAFVFPCQTMKPESPISRRNWLGLVSTASIGSGLLGAASSADAAEVSARALPNRNTLGARIYNIRDFGARGDGKTLDTAAVQAAIDACTRDQGGTVLVPAGDFVIGPVELKSHVTLHLAAKGKLLGSPRGKDYHAVDAIPLEGDSTLADGNWSLVYAVKAENITVEGPGTIDGNGVALRGTIRHATPATGITGSHRPYHLLFHQCRNIRIRDSYYFNCAYHSIRMIQSQYIWIDGIRIFNRVNSNNDGFHFISCQHVHLSNSTVVCADDACALFGSCKFVTVTGCAFSTRWSVFRFGGGEAENITVSNCLIYETFGCPIKIAGGGRSRFENMSFSNIVMKNVTGPISISLGNRGQWRRPPGAAAGTNTVAAVQSTNAVPAQAAHPEEPAHGGILRNISFRGIQATVVVPYQIPDFLPESPYNPGEIKSCIGINSAGDTFIENITFDDVHITFAGGGTAEEAAVRDVPKVVGEYYAVGVFPAYGMFARKVRGLTLHNVRFEVASPELRPALVFDHVEDAAINGFSAQGNAKAESLLRFIDSKDVLLTAPRVLAPVPVFLQVEGAASAGIKVDGGDLSKASEPLAVKSGAAESAVKLRVL
jgi:hypothetical protein